MRYRKRRGSKRRGRAGRRVVRRRMAPKARMARRRAKMIGDRF